MGLDEFALDLVTIIPYDPVTADALIVNGLTDQPATQLDFDTTITTETSEVTYADNYDPDSPIVQLRSDNSIAGMIYVDYNANNTYDSLTEILIV